MSQMSFFGEAINVSNVDPKAGGFEPIPAGWYTAIPEDIDVQQKDFGYSAKVKFRVTGETHVNRVIFDNLVLTHNTSSKAQDIGQQRLRAWCDAAGVDPNLTSMEPFVGREVRIKVRIDPPRTGNDGKQYNANNRIENFAPMMDESNAAAPVVRQPAAAKPAVASAPKAAPAAATPAATTRAPMPWEKRA